MWQVYQPDFVAYVDWLKLSCHWVRILRPFGSSPQLLRISRLDGAWRPGCCGCGRPARKEGFPGLACAY